MEIGFGYSWVESIEVGVGKIGAPPTAHKVEDAQTVTIQFDLKRLVPIAAAPSPGVNLIPPVLAPNLRRFASLHADGSAP